MTKIQIIAGTTRPGRVSIQIAEWALEQAKKRSDAEFELVDLADFDLPMYDESVPPKAHQYEHGYTRRWAEKVNEADGYIIVTGEYNHGMPAALKNALDYVYAEWNNKSLGIISYGSAGGVRAAEHLRGVAGELQLADVSNQLVIFGHTNIENWTTFVPDEKLEEGLTGVFAKTIEWADALAPLRQK